MTHYIGSIKRAVAAVPVSIWRLAFFSLLGHIVLAILPYLSVGALQGFAYHLGFISEESVFPAFRFLVQSEVSVFLLLIVVAVAQGGASYVAMFINIIMAETYVFEARKNLNDAVFGQKGVYTRSSGEVASILSEVIPKSGGFLASLIKFTALTAQALITLTLCFYVAFRGTFLILFGLILFAPLIKYLNSVSRGYGRMLIEQVRLLTTELMQSIRNIHFLKIIGRDNEEKNKVMAHCHEYLRQYTRFAKVYSFANTAPSVYGMLVLVAFFYLSRFYWATPPMIIFSLYYMLVRFIQAASQAVGMTNGISNYVPSFIVMVKLHEENEALRKEKGLKQLAAQSEKKQQATSSFSIATLEAKNISFKFPGDRSATPVFKNISFKLDFPSCLVIQGPSGTGKSTLLYTLLGLYSPDQGQILWGGIPLDKIPLKQFREAIAYIGPEAFLKEGTVYENLCYGLNKKPTEEELIAAVKQADCLDFIYASNHKWETMISENGLGLSAGQKQRLGFARAYLRQPKILILDEATSNLDMETEARIIDNLKPIKNKMIILAASHRDRILEIADQKIYLK